MSYVEELQELIQINVHSATHFYISASKHRLLKILRNRYVSWWIEDVSFETLQILAQLELHAFDYPIKKPSPKQIKQRRLASQLWQLSGAIGSLKNIRVASSLHQLMLERQIETLKIIEEQLRHQLRNL